MNIEKMHRIGKWIFILFGGAVTANAVIATLLSNVNMGILLTYAMGLFLLLYGIFYDTLTAKLPKAVKYIFLAGVIAVIAFVLSLFIYGNSNNATYKEDAVIVLGAGVRGEQPSETLKNRLDGAIDYYSKNPDAVIVVSGGKGSEENITEALAMERYLVEHGIPNSNIMKEENATSTNENFRYSKKLLDDYFDGEYSVVFITNDFHVYRSENLARLAGFENITHCNTSTPWYSAIPNGIRECLAVIKLWILKR